MIVGAQGCCLLAQSAAEVFRSDVSWCLLRVILHAVLNQIHTHQAPDEQLDLREISLTPVVVPTRCTGRRTRSRRGRGAECLRQCYHM